MFHAHQHQHLGQPHQSPITTSSTTADASQLPQQLTLASINARQSPDSLNTRTNYAKPWIPDYSQVQTSLDLGLLPAGFFIGHHDFQSNHTFDSAAAMASLPFDDSMAPKGLGIQYPDPTTTSDFSFTFSPSDSQVELDPDVFPSFSPRLEASYSSNGPSFRDGEGSANGSLQSSWSLSRLFSEMQHTGGSGNTSLHGSDQFSTNPSLTLDSNTTDDISLESLSAAAGLSIEEFTNKITEGAKLALEQAAAEFAPVPPPLVGHPPVALAHVNRFLPSVPGPSTMDLPPFSGIPELDMYGLGGESWFPSCLGINPADVMPAPSMPSTSNSLTDMFGLLGNPLQLDETSVVNFPPLTDLMYPGTSTPPAQVIGLGHPQVLRSTPTGREDGDGLSDYEPPPFLSPSSSEYSPSMGSGRPYHTRGSRVKKRKAPFQGLDTNLDGGQSSSCAQTHAMPVPVQIQGIAQLPPIDLGSPVFDAHRGIDIEDLKARAERYRLRNQGREYDKRWLLSYAGKLSSKGELLEEFRCYVTGCQQVNKRRDHILIHVGAHLDQRPFKCAHW